ncbi:hypothetical protein GC209_14385 [bacterium]|nr:hypothetical protein [bacterium]
MVTDDNLGLELTDKLGHWANQFIESGLFSVDTIAEAYLAIGLEIARVKCGGVQAAEWLRNIADEIERPELASVARC